MFLFFGLSRTATSLLSLTPSILCSENTESTDINDAVSMYKDDLESPELVGQEVLMWKKR